MALSANQMEILITARDTASKVIKTVSSSMKKLGTVAGKAAKSIVSAFGNVAKKIFSLKTAFFGLAGAAGMGYMIKRSYATIDAIGKVSQKIGVSTDALQKFQYAAGIAGISTETTNMALQRFTRRAAEAAKGTGEAKDALKEMGIRVTDMTGRVKPTEVLLGEVADAFSKVKRDSDLTRLAMKLFDSEGVAMINMLKGGKKALFEMTNEAARLGLVLDNQTIAQVTAANDMFFRMGELLGGIFNRITASLAPALEKFGKWWVSFLASFQSAIQPALSWINTNFLNMATNIDGAKKTGAEWGAVVNDALIAATEAIRNFFTGTDQTVSKWDEFKNTLINIYNWISANFIPMWEDIQKGIEFVKNQYQQLVTVFEQQGIKSWTDLIVKADQYIVKLKEVARQAFVVASALAGAKIGGALGSVAGPVGTVIGAVAGAAIGGGAAYFGTRASGGGVQANKPYLVGERGPEMFTPSRSGSIAANTGSTTVVNNIYTAATAHGINNALASRGDSASRSTRVGMTVSGSRSTSAFGNVSGVRR